MSFKDALKNARKVKGKKGKKGKPETPEEEEGGKENPFEALKKRKK